MKAPIKSYDTAYPGSMHQREDGYYLERNDHVSLAHGLLELIASRDREIADLRDAVAVNAAAPELLEQLKLVLPILEGINSRCTNDTAMILNVRAAITKATGGAS